MAKIGRPANADLNDPAVVERICERMIAGEAIATICKDNDMPAESTVYVKMAADESFRSIIAKAREAQQEAMIDCTVAMADAATIEDWQVVKLRIWARQWRAGKLAPKKYGDKLDVTSGGDKLQPIDEVGQLTRLASLSATIKLRLENHSDDEVDEMKLLEN
jgi:hypothetical protein